MKDQSLFTSVGKNLSVLGVAQMVTWISSFLLLMFLPKYLGSQEFGLLFVALSVREILSMIIDFGGSHRIPKSIAQDPLHKRQIVAQYLLLRIVIWMAITLLILSSGWIFGKGEDLMPLIEIFLLANLFEGISKTYRSFYQGIEQMKLPSLSLILEKIVVSIFAIGFLLSGANAFSIAVIFTAGTLLNLLFLWGMSRKDLSVQLKWDPAMKSTARIAMPYFLWSLFSMIYFRIDALMLHAYSPDVVAGWYGGAYRFFDAVMILPALLKVALFPVFSRLASDSTHRLEDVFEKSLRFTVLMAIPISLVVFLSASWVIDFFMGLEDYEPSVVILKIFCLAIPLMFADFILGSILVGSANRQSYWAGVGFAAILLNVSLNLWLIPLFQDLNGNGGAGAAIATVITEGFILGSALFLIPRSYYRNFQLDRYGKLIGVLILFFGLLWVMQTSKVSPLVQLFVTLILFGLTLWGFSFISKDERIQLVRFLQGFFGLKRPFQKSISSHFGGSK